MAIPVFGQPQPGIQYTDRPGAYGILLNEDRWVALVKTPNGRFLPGGGLEGKETPEQALHREIFEEVGIRILSSQAIGEAAQYVYSRFYKQGFRKHGYFYTCTWELVPGSTPQADHSLEWFKSENVLEAMSLDFQKWMIKKSLGL